MRRINNLNQVRRHEVHPASAQVAFDLNNLTCFCGVLDGSERLCRVGANRGSRSGHDQDIDNENIK